MAKMLEIFDSLELRTAGPDAAAEPKSECVTGLLLALSDHFSPFVIIGQQLYECMKMPLAYGTGDDLKVQTQHLSHKFTANPQANIKIEIDGQS